MPTVRATRGLKENSIRTVKVYVLLPVGCQDPLGLVVAGQPVDPALDQDQTELGVFVLQEINSRLINPPS